MGTRERRTREKQERRREILDSARKLFWKRGFTGTTMPDIAAATELAPGTLYLYFPSKDALYVELLVEGYDLLLASLRAAAAGSGKPRRQVEGLIDAFMQFAREHPEYFEVIFFVLQRESDGARQTLLAEDQLRRLEAQEEACKAAAGEVLGRAAGGLSAEKLRLTVDAVWSMLVGVIFFWRKDGEETFAAVSKRAKELVLAAVARE